jgi:hypothetical protein
VRKRERERESVRECEGARKGERDRLGPAVKEVHARRWWAKRQPERTRKQGAAVPSVEPNRRQELDPSLVWQSRIRLYQRGNRTAKIARFGPTLRTGGGIGDPPFFSTLPIETKVESGTSQSKSGIFVGLRDSGNLEKSLTPRHSSSVSPRSELADALRLPHPLQGLGFGVQSF